MVVVQGGRIAFVGVVIGLAVAIAAARALDTLVFGVATFDLPTLAATAAAMMAIALIACYIPARRASSVDPLQSLTIE